MSSEELSEDAERLMSAQIALVQLALDFAGDHVADVFVYASAEEGMCSYNAFYGDGQRISRPDHIAGKSKQDVRAFLVEGTLLVDSQNQVFLEGGQDAPTEFRIHYDVTRGSLESEISYTNEFYSSQELTSSDVFREWRSEVMRKYS